jgi:hypothetical protein
MSEAVGLPSAPDATMTQDQFRRSSLARSAEVLHHHTSNVEKIVDNRPNNSRIIAGCSTPSGFTLLMRSST